MEHPQGVRAHGPPNFTPARRGAKSSSFHGAGEARSLFGVESYEEQAPVPTSATEFCALSISGPTSWPVRANPTLGR